MTLTLKDRLDRLGMRLSRSRRFDGLWLGVFGGKRDDHMLGRIEEALKLIKIHDASRYQRLLRDVDRIWIQVLCGPVGNFNARLRTCSLDIRFVGMAPTEVIASTIVHEATHAQPRLLKLGYREGLRHRIERICIRQELAFADRLPGGSILREVLKPELARPGTDWSDEARAERHIAGELAAARFVGLPDWLTRLLRAVGRIIGRVVGTAR